MEISMYRFLWILLLLTPLSAVATPRIICASEESTCDVADNTYPWMAALVQIDEKPLEGQYCGGTLVHPEWVLTAGHCVDDKDAEDFYIMLGRTKLSAAQTGEIIRVKEIVRHPGFAIENKTAPPRNDIALVRLEHPARQPPLRIAEGYSDLIIEGERATVIGWGTKRLNPTHYADRLQHVEVPIVSNDVCSAPQSYAGDIHEEMMCAGFTEGGSDACLGDSGGPLVVNSGNSWQQIGIVSFGEGCGEPNFYGVYTRVPSFQEFISTTVCQPEDIPASPQLQVQIEGQTAPYLVTASWNEVTNAEGYQFYYAPYVPSLSELNLGSIHSFDRGALTSFSAELPSDLSFYIAVRAYHGNCYSTFSLESIGKVILPPSPEGPEM